ncbi:hypothetical protein R83H12_01808 [Fibrobacteria bacterium R8-3-H12]
MLDNEFNASREHKNNVFTLLFSDPQATLELYNAVTGKNYPPDTKIEIVTLSNALFKGQLNDVAFVLDGKLVVLMEHQSTINPNMPLRMLIYMGREYEIMTKSKDLYREKLIEIPAPEFIVLYNGKEEFPDFKELRLSDSYKSKDGSCNLELVAKVYNINKGRNAEIARRSPVLSDYSELVAEVNKNRETMELSDAIKVAVKSCMERNILLNFLERHASEVMNMIFTEWNWDDAKQVWQEEAMEKSVLQTAKNMLLDGLEPARVARITKLPEEQIMVLK